MCSIFLRFPLEFYFINIDFPLSIGNTSNCILLVYPNAKIVVKNGFEFDVGWEVVTEVDRFDRWAIIFARYIIIDMRV